MQFRDLTPHGVDKYRVNIPTPKARTKDVAAIRSRRSDGLDVPSLLQQVYTIHKKAGTFHNDMPIVSMSYIDMQSELKKRCKKLGIKARNGRRIGTHGFRRGKATHLHALGVRVSDIMLLGRWRSTACLRYLDLTLQVRGTRSSVPTTEHQSLTSIQPVCHRATRSTSIIVNRRKEQQNTWHTYLGIAPITATAGTRPRAHWVAAREGNSQAWRPTPIWARRLEEISGGALSD
ncbi:MAG: hypothetical protein MHM6MM_009111 [Cercozoa sp. M6MM]